jgi:hypothetical protein
MAHLSLDGEPLRSIKEFATVLPEGDVQK